MKKSLLAAVAALIAVQPAFAVDNAAIQQRLIEDGFLPEPIEASEIVRTVPAEPETPTEALLVEWGFKPQPVERVLATEQRVVTDTMPDDPVQRRLVEWGFKPQPARNVSTLVGAGERDVNAGS
ncbi:hypothetical protein QWY84_09725 [Aquisalimonas lutea]|uniref:hypothetical protein n=1 Tax=Aquisalimonas lutea TaxID=1327750 RepID=UPI0025B3C6CC|nr:hypothetical protein [Aquisalimonas lutea]MDN3517889.1 hypothetical protein [Aquisalimonas lutea]